jgi:hypothetical protein
MERLVVVGIAGELGPGLTLVKLNPIGGQSLSRKVNKRRMHTDQIKGG